MPTSRQAKTAAGVPVGNNVGVVGGRSGVGVRVGNTGPVVKGVGVGVARAGVAVGTGVLIQARAGVGVGVKMIGGVWPHQLQALW